MRSCPNKKTGMFIFFITAKSFILLILLSFIMGHGNMLLVKAASFLPFASPSGSGFWAKPIVQAENRYQPLILEAAFRYNIEPAIINAIIMAESGFNPKAVSNVGAMGLMQLMPRTARSLGVEDSFEPAHNIDAGVRYFKHLLDRFDGDIELALAAYNAGISNVRKYGGIPPFKATKFYIDKVLKYYEAYRTT